MRPHLGAWQSVDIACICSMVLVLAVGPPGWVGELSTKLSEEELCYGVVVS